jgi:hypothetical protein
VLLVRTDVSEEHITEARVLARLKFLGSVVDIAAPGEISSEYFAFPRHPFIPLPVPTSSPSIIQVWYNRQINIRRNSGLGTTPAP